MIRKPNLAIMITMLLLLVLPLLAAPASVSASGMPEILNAVDTAEIYLAVIIAVVLLSVTVFLLFISRSRLKKAEHEIKALNGLRETFMNANSGMIYLKDENQKYIFINKAFESITGRPASEIIGRSDYEIFSAEFADLRGHSDLSALKEKTVLVDEVQYKEKIYQTTKFPVTLNNGKTGIGAYIRDVSEERMLRRQQEKALHRNKILLDVFSLAFESTQEQLDYVLNRALELTGSQYGFLYFYDEQLREFTLNAWTNGVMGDCEISKFQAHCTLEKAGIWGEAIRQASPVVINDFHLPNPLKKGYPDGHVKLDRFMSIPVMIDGSIVAVVGLANKPNDYDASDVYETTLLMSGAWQACERKQTQERLHLERNKYLQTLISIGDGVMVVDRDGKIEMLNNVAQNLTGWPVEEALGRLYTEEIGRASCRERV